MIQVKNAWQVKSNVSVDRLSLIHTRITDFKSVCDLLQSGDPVRTISNMLNME